MDGFWELFGRSRSPMLLLDDEAIYRDVNDALCRAIGRPREQVVGQRLGFVSTPAQRRDIDKLWARFVADRHLVTGWDAAQGDGTIVGVEVIVTAEVPEPGRHLAVFLPPWRPRADGRLSPREIEVTALLARGFSGEQ